MQRAAIEGEMAYLIATSNSDSDILFRLYFVLSEADDSLKGLILECFKSLVKFPEETYARILGEVSTKTVPLWLWENKVLDDIKEVLKHGESFESSCPIMEKRDLRKAIIKSAFILFCKRLCSFSVTVPINLCRKVLADNSLDFLHSSCFALIRDLSEAVEMGVVSLEDSQKNLIEVLNMSFDAKDILSYRIEVSALEYLNNMDNKLNDKGSSEDTPVTSKDSISESTEDSMQSPKKESELDEILSNLIMKHNKEITKGRKRKNPFVVRKIFSDKQTIVTLKTFKALKEAEDYVEKIVDECPELTSTCTFVIEDFNHKDMIYVFSED